MDNEWSPLQKNLELYEKIVADFISAGYEPEQIAPFMIRGCKLEFEKYFEETGYLMHIRCLINQFGLTTMWCAVADIDGVEEEEITVNAYNEITGEFTLANIFKNYWGF